MTPTTSGARTKGHGIRTRLTGTLLAFTLLAAPSAGTAATAYAAETTTPTPAASATASPYSIDDLKDMTATVDGRPIPGFDYRGGVWHIGKGNTAQLGKLPDGWKPISASVQPSQGPTPATPYLIITIASPDHKVKATYMFIQDDTASDGGDTATYSIDDLKDMTATVDGRPIPGFDYRGGVWHIGKGNTAQLGNLPDGWKPISASVQPSQGPAPATPYTVIAIASPDHKVEVTYMFIQDDPADKDTDGKPQATPTAGASTNPSPAGAAATPTATGAATATRADTAKTATSRPDRLASTGAAITGLSLTATILTLLGLAATRLRRSHGD